MERITIKHLRGLCETLNRMTDHALEPYTRDADGKLRANVGNYHIHSAYGGHTLHQMANESGGVRTPLSCGHVPARELYNLMHAYLNGIERQERGIA